MDKIFADMFSREPDETANSDYFYHTWLKNSLAETEKSTGFIGGRSLKEYYEWREKGIKENFQKNYENRTIRDESSSLAIYWTWMKDTVIHETINKIAAQGKPFMDIASSDGMGLAAYIIKENKNIPCLLTDIDDHVIKCLRSCVSEHLNDYNINIASFDNTDMPIKDNSLDCITSIHGFTSSPERGKSKFYQFFAGTEKVIGEAYRIVKPGGCVITIEQDIHCICDSQKLLNKFTEHGKLFGIYTYDEIQALRELFAEKQWNDKFISAGFDIECERNHPRKYSTDDLKYFLQTATRFYKIHDFTDEDIVVSSLPKSTVSHIIKEIQSRQTIQEVMKGGTTLEMFNSSGKFMKQDKNGMSRKFTEDEIRNLACKYLDYDKIIEYAEDDDDNDEVGIDIYHANTFYILRKP